MRFLPLSSCETLCYLNLSCFILEPPPMFNGFGNLKSLRLESVTLTDEALERMIFTCTVLERLVLYELIGCFRFKIPGPCLQYFYLIGEFNNICFDDAPRLSSAVMGSYYCAVDEHVGQGETSNLNKALGCLTGLEKLGMYHHFLQILARGSIPERLPVTLDYLKSITLEMNFNDLDETSVVLCLLRSSPNLQELWLQVSHFRFVFFSDIALQWFKLTILNQSNVRVTKDLSLNPILTRTHAKQVIGFNRVSVPAGGSKKVKFTFNACKSLSVVENNGYKLLPSGGHTIMVGDGEISFPFQVNFQY
ncbi:hypothetical protein HHK36_023042 [Tetracentron sinense]|uniref:Fibronectin type III-like domain-containing protein n=1 Tax=Tetracentron sinense TaxID=13715 RepID=A0A834YU81_TETSI|nr:hypothetical protein HHK36_023042 [Tetracentron sinense]